MKKITKERFKTFLYWFKKFLLFILLFLFIGSLLDEYSSIYDEFNFFAVTLGLSLIIAYAWSNIINPLIVRFIKK